MKTSSYWYDGHMCNWPSLAYYEIGRYKSAKYVMHWYDAVPTGIIKICGPNFHITTLNIIINLAMKSRLVVRNRKEPPYTSQQVNLFPAR